VLTIRQNVD